jgi:hypothetical protein
MDNAGFRGRSQVERGWGGLADLKYLMIAINYGEQLINFI